MTLRASRFHGARKFKIRIVNNRCEAQSCSDSDTADETSDNEHDTNKLKRQMFHAQVYAQCECCCLQSNRLPKQLTSVCFEYAMYSIGQWLQPMRMKFTVDGILLYFVRFTLSFTVNWLLAANVLRQSEADSYARLAAGVSDFLRRCFLFIVRPLFR